MTYTASMPGVWVGRTDSGYRRSMLKDKNLIPFYSPLDPGAAQHMSAWRSETGLPCGMYSDPHWYGLAADGKALAYRQRLDADIAALCQLGDPVSIDLEFLSLDFVRRLFLGSTGNRGLLRSGNTNSPMGTQQGRRILRYTNMPFQNGTVVPIDVFQKCPELQWDAQMYYGNMDPAAEASVVLEIARWGVMAAQIHAFRDGKLMASDDRDAMYFTAERLPGMYALKMLGDGTLGADTLGGTDITQWSKLELRDHYAELAGSA